MLSGDGTVNRRPELMRNVSPVTHNRRKTERAQISSALSSLFFALSALRIVSAAAAPPRGIRYLRERPGPRLLIIYCDGVIRLSAPFI